MVLIFKMLQIAQPAYCSNLLSCGKRLSILYFSGTGSPTPWMNKVLDQYLEEVVELLSL